MPTRVFSEEEKAKLKQLMLEQGIPLLEEYGLKHMSVDKITKRVGIGKSTFYNFFDSKEDYVSQALEVNREMMLSEIDKAFPDGKKMKPAQLFGMFFNTLLSQNTFYSKFSAEDERALYEADKRRGKEVSLDRETVIGMRIFSHVEGVREDLDVGLIANYIKLIVLAYENEYMFHDSAMERMQSELKYRLIDLIFEEESKRELLELLSESGRSVNDLPEDDKEVVRKVNQYQGEAAKRKLERK
jgi:AcrR family transcriptional regulator